jgi:heme o synthase
LAGTLYGVIAAVSSTIFVALTAWCLIVDAPTPAAMKPERTLFIYSIGYVLLIFAALAFDRNIA